MPKIARSAKKTQHISTSAEKISSEERAKQGENMKSRSGDARRSNKSRSCEAWRKYQVKIARSAKEH